VNTAAELCYIRERLAVDAYKLRFHAEEADPSPEADQLRETADRLDEARERLERQRGGFDG
jgi:hypothetical protein